MLIIILVSIFFPLVTPLLHLSSTPCNLLFPSLPPSIRITYWSVGYVTPTDIMRLVELQTSLVITSSVPSLIISLAFTRCVCVCMIQQRDKIIVVVEKERIILT